MIILEKTFINDLVDECQIGKPPKVTRVINILALDSFTKSSFTVTKQLYCK